MTEKTKFKSSVFEAIHSAAAGMFKASVIPQETMRSFDATCIEDVEKIQLSEIKNHVEN